MPCSRLTKEGAVGSCGLSVVGNYSFDDEDADLEEDAEDDERRQAWGLEATEQARSSTCSAGTRDNKTSYQLLDAYGGLWPTWRWASCSTPNRVSFAGCRERRRRALCGVPRSTGTATAERNKNRCIVLIIVET